MAIDWLSGVLRFLFDSKINMYGADVAHGEPGKNGWVVGGDGRRGHTLMRQCLAWQAMLLRDSTFSHFKFTKYARFYGVDVRRLERGLMETH